MIEIRNESLPVLDLEHLFQMPRFSCDSVGGIFVVAEGRRVAILVDGLLGQ